MKLYYSPGACSLSPHITLEESGLAYEALAAPTKTHQLADGTDYYTINPLGYVPLLELDDGARLREGPAIVQYVADQVPGKKLAPANGSMARYRLQEWLTFIGTELHKGGFSLLFNPANPDTVKAAVKDKLAQRLKWVDGQLAGKDYLMGEFSVADPYLYTVSRWSVPTGVDLSGFANLQAFRARMAARPAVLAALKAEGLTP